MAHAGFVAALASIMDGRINGQPVRPESPMVPSGEALMQVIKVRSESNPSGVAGAIANSIRKLDYNPRGEIEIRVVGERANYMATKAIGIAKDYLSKERPGLILAAIVTLEQVDLSGVDHTMIVYRLGWCDQLEAV